MSEPVVSIVIPAYNGAALIGETLNSLSRQSLADFEAIVVDDGSTDGTRSLVADWPDRRVRLIEMQRNGGPVAARNRGVAEARGRYIAGLDQDDLCRPERLARQVAHLQSNAETMLIATGADGLDNNRVRSLGYPAHTTPTLIRWLLWIENPLAWSSVMLRTDAARRLQPFTRPALVYAEDFDLYHRLLPLGDITRLDEPLVIYRQHAGGVSKRFAETMLSSATRVLAECHAGRLGHDAATTAALLARHVMGREPVADGETLAKLGGALARLQAAFLAENRPDAESSRLIRWETARRWAAIGRAALRSGRVTLAEVIAARPPHLGLGYADPGALVWSGTVGSVRRWRAQTFAEKIIRPGPSAANT